MVAALQNALESRRLLAGMVLSWVLAVQVHTAHLLFFLTELVHPSFTLLVPYH